MTNATRAQHLAWEAMADDMTEQSIRAIMSSSLKMTDEDFLLIWSATENSRGWAKNLITMALSEIELRLQMRDSAQNN